MMDVDLSGCVSDLAGLSPIGHEAALYCRASIDLQESV